MLLGGDCTNVAWRGVEQQCGTSFAGFSASSQLQSLKRLICSDYGESFRTKSEIHVAPFLKEAKSSNLKLEGVTAAYYPSK